MKKFALILGIVSLVAACNTVEEPSNIQDQAAQKTNQVVNAPVLNASIEEAAETKSYLNESDWSILWTANDEISAFVQNTSNWEYKFAGATGDQSGAFNPVDAPEGGSALNYIYAVYPYSASNTIAASGVMTVNFPATQTYKAKSFGQGANTMVAVAADKESALQFKNACGFLMLKLYGTNVKVKSVSLKGNNNEKIAGAATITMPLNGNPTVAMASDATDEIKVNCSSSLTLGNSDSNYTEFWFAIPPVTFTEGFTITVTTSRGTTFTKSLNKEFVVERGKGKKMAPIEVKVPTDLSFNGLANCYIVNITGNNDDLNPLGYCFKATDAGNGVAAQPAGILGAVGLSLAYPSPNNTSALAEGHYVRVPLNQNNCISDVTIANGTICFKATGAKGNAKIQMRDANDDGVWVWHIWCTDQPGSVTIPTSDGTKNYTLLDRNLGAITNQPGITEAECGLYYMFGDPIGYTVAEWGNGNEDAYRMVDELAHSPSFPYCNRGGEYTWFNMWQASANPRQVYAFLWGAYGDGAGATWGSTYNTQPGTKSFKVLYDPCPVGYKVMAKDVLDGYFDTRNKSNFTADATGIYVAGNDASLYIPYGGACWKGGYSSAAGSYCFLWTSAHNNANMSWGYNITKNEDDIASWGNFGQDQYGNNVGVIIARGMPVRCMKQ